VDAVNRQLTSPVGDKFARSYIVYACFFISGFAALIFQLSWQRLLLRILGSTLPAVSIVLSVFMAGLALGCFVCGKNVRRIRNPLIWYALMELIVGASGVLSLWLLGSHPNSALFSSCLLLVPTTAMGATFSLVGMFLHETRPGARNQGTAYFANLAGAASGVVCAGFLLMPNFGLSATIVTAAFLSFSVSGVLGLVFRTQNLPASIQTPKAFSIDQRRLIGLISIVVLVNGAAGMVLEVVWSRLFSLLVGSSTYSVASVLSISIIGLAVGTAIFQKIGTQLNNHKIILAILCGSIAASLYLDLWLIQLMPWLFNLNHEILAKSNSYFAYLLERISVISLVVLVPAVLCGGVFPISLHAVSNAELKQNALGSLYIFSAIGSVLGALSAGFLFIPLLGRVFTSGMESTICLLIIIEVALSMLIIYTSSLKRVLISIPLVFILALLIRPAWNKSLISSGIPFLSLPTKASNTKEIFDRVLSDSANNKLLFYREGLNTTVTVNSNDAQNIVYLKNDGKVEAALPLNPHHNADTSDLATHFMLGKIPALIYPASTKKVFVVGFGSGATSGGVLDASTVEKLWIAEVEPTIFEVQHFFEPSNGSPLRKDWLQSGRVTPFCGDARVALNFSNEKFDAIVSQPAEPWVSGSADLYTLQFWQLAKSKLNARGCFCQWIQLYAIDPEYLSVLCRTFQNVFPNSYVIHYPRAGEIILLGTIEPLDTRELSRLPSLVATPDSLRKACLQLGTKYGDFRLNTDDNMLTEYSLPQHLYLSESLIDENLQAISDR
jgi:spermidine synthase